MLISGHTMYTRFRRTRTRRVCSLLIALFFCSERQGGWRTPSSPSAMSPPRHHPCSHETRDGGVCHITGWAYNVCLHFVFPPHHLPCHHCPPSHEMRDGGVYHVNPTLPLVFREMELLPCHHHPSLTRNRRRREMCTECGRTLYTHSFFLSFISIYFSSQ